MLLILFSLFSALTISHPTNSRLTVEISNIAKTGGEVRVALFKPNAKFATSKPDFFKIISITRTGTRQVVFDVEPGRYAVAVHHDVNQNGKMDKNGIGYPKEPYGFSNNYRPVFSAPKFEDCAFTLGAQGTSISIKLID